MRFPPVSMIDFDTTRPVTVLGSENCSESGSMLARSVGDAGCGDALTLGVVLWVTVGVGVVSTGLGVGVGVVAGACVVGDAHSVTTTLGAASCVA